MCLIRPKSTGAHFERSRDAGSRFVSYKSHTRDTMIIRRIPSIRLMTFDRQSSRTYIICYIFIYYYTWRAGSGYRFGDTCFFDEDCAWQYIRGLFSPSRR